VCILSVINVTNHRKNVRLSDCDSFDLAVWESERENTQYNELSHEMRSQVILKSIVIAHARDP
jgi:hypothetical protein